ncbi:MAG: ribonuclease P protein component [Blastocatellia bacterium]|nr:ribonuclease P protein component [Blastocatellia bacterium]
MEQENRLRPCRFFYRKDERLLCSHQFKSVYEKGQRFNSHLFTLFALASSQPLSRFGVTVTKKVGNAVQRNRCKRILREVFRQQKMAVIKKYDLVINAKKPLVRAAYTEAEIEFSRLLSLLQHSQK